MHGESVLIPKLRQEESGVIVIAGLQICYGSIEIPANQDKTTVTFRRAFKGSPKVVLTNVFVYAQDVFWSTSTITETTASVYAWSNSRGNAILRSAQYIAIGHAS